VACPFALLYRGSIERTTRIMASKKRTADGVIKKNPLVTVELEESIRDDELCEFTAQISANGQGMGNARLI